MSDLHRPVLRATVGRLAITGAATLATVFAVAPGALAADDEPTTTEPTTEAPAVADEVVVDAPAEEPAPPSDTEAEVDAEEPSADEAENTSEKAGKTDKAEKDDDATTQAVEPRFGFQKFRVGVRLADGRTDPSTVGSELKIVIKDQDGEVDDTITCQTDESTVEPGTSASFCLGRPPFGRAERSRVDVEPGPIPGAQAFTLFPGQSATVTNTAAASGLERATQTATIEPCVEDDPPVCGQFDDEDTFLNPQSVIFTLDLPDGDVDDNGAEDDGDVDDSGAEDDDAVLPDTGGADPALLGYAGLLMAGGTWLTLRGRRRADATVD